MILNKSLDFSSSALQSCNSQLLITNLAEGFHQTTGPFPMQLYEQELALLSVITMIPAHTQSSPLTRLDSAASVTGRCLP